MNEREYIPGEVRDEASNGSEEKVWGSNIVALAVRSCS